MRKVFVRVADAWRRFICKVMGHKRVRGSVGTVGVLACVRCHRITDQRTAMRAVTRGELERRLAARLPDGWTLNRINWKKRVVHLTDARGNPHTELLALS